MFMNIYSNKYARNMVFLTMMQDKVWTNATGTTIGLFYVNVPVSWSRELCLNHYTKR